MSLFRKSSNTFPYIKAVCRLTEQLGGELINTEFPKNLTLPPQVILARVLSESAGRIKPSH